MDRKLGAITLCAALAGCVQQAALMKQTGSGFAEATFEGISVDEMKNEVALACTQKGAEVQTDQFSVTCGKRDDSGRGFMAQALMGNGYSQTPWQKMKITMASTGSGVFVTAQMWMEMTMGFGEVKRIPDTNVADRNMMQAQLDAAAQRAMARKTGQAPSPATLAVPAPEPCVACANISKH